jgi:membrane-associated phospholipid phosphatase
MTLLVLHGLWTPITLLFFVFAARPHSNPLRDLAATARRGVTTRGGRTVFAVLLGTLLFDAVECRFEPGLTRALGYDMTPWVRSVEGDLVERVQAFVPAALVGPLIWFYLSAYIAMILAPFVVWTVSGEHRAVRGWTVGFLANYLLALPFYLFFPVSEVAWSGVSDAQPLLDAVWPGLSGESRFASALNNCFPSLHVSCMVTVLVFCGVHGPAGLRWLGWILALGTAWCVMALGIHWGLDVVAGVPLGLLCAGIGRAAARRASRDEART